jgi:coenzyme F420 hydrogenase subunit beta
VVVSNLKEDNPLKSCTDLVYSPEEIDNSASSIYAPVTACTVLDQLKDISGRICFIGIPCHIQALRKAQRNVRWLKDKEIFAVGIFCSWTAGAYATRAFLGYHNIQLQNVKKIVYRSEGWPGKIQIHMKDCTNPTFFPRGREANFIARLKYGAAFNRRGFFASRRCLACPDHLAELADISLGDAWKITPPNDLGFNTIITRSDQSDLVLNELSSAKRIFKDPITSEDLIKSQAKNLASKKKAFLIWNILSKKDKKIPVFSGQPVLEANIFEKIVAIMEIASIKLGKKGVCWKFLPYLAPLISMLRRLAGKRMKTI